MSTVTLFLVRRALSAWVDHPQTPQHLQLSALQMQMPYEDNEQSLLWSVTNTAIYRRCVPAALELVQWSMHATSHILSSYWEMQYCVSRHSSHCAPHAYKWASLIQWNGTSSKPPDLLQNLSRGCIYTFSDLNSDINDIQYHQLNTAFSYAFLESPLSKCTSSSPCHGQVCIAVAFCFEGSFSC